MTLHNDGRSTLCAHGFHDGRCDDDRCRCNCHIDWDTPWEARFNKYGESGLTDEEYDDAERAGILVPGVTNF